MLWFVQVNGQKTTVKKKITYFLKNCCFIHIFRKTLLKKNLQIFYRLVFRCNTFFILFVWSSIHFIGIFVAGRKCRELVVVFKTFLPQKIFMSCLYLRHGAYLNSTSNVFAYLVIIFLGHDWFGVFLNKWRRIRSTFYWHISLDDSI